LEEKKKNFSMLHIPSKRQALMNPIWFGLIVCSVLAGGFHGTLREVTQASFEGAKAAVTLAIGLVGVMSLWLGLVKVAEAGGLMSVIARVIRPVMTRLFPDVPAEDPAMSAMLLNMAANALGLGNAATPLGIKAMIALDRLNPHPGKATDAMCLFLAINTSNVTLLPLGVIGVRAAAGAADPAAILLPTLLATSCSTLIAVLAAKSLKRFHVGDEEGEVKTGSNRDAGGPADEAQPYAQNVPSGTNPWRTWLAGIVFLLFVVSILWHVAESDVTTDHLSSWLIPGLMLAMICYGFGRNVPVYEQAIEGAKEGFEVAVRLIPFLVMILVAVEMFRASGAFDIVARLASPVTRLLDVPAEVLPVALLRPLSGSGAFGLMSEITARDPDGFAAFLAGTIQGSTETTFYVLAVYFGAVGIQRIRYAVTAALCADLAGFLAAIAACRWLYPL